MSVGIIEDILYRVSHVDISELIAGHGTGNDIGLNGNTVQAVALIRTSCGACRVSAMRGTGIIGRQASNLLRSLIATARQSESVDDGRNARGILWHIHRADA